MSGFVLLPFFFAMFILHFSFYFCRFFPVCVCFNAASALHYSWFAKRNNIPRHDLSLKTNTHTDTRGQRNNHLLLLASRSFGRHSTARGTIEGGKYAKIAIRTSSNGKGQAGLCGARCVPALGALKSDTAKHKTISAKTKTDKPLPLLLLIPGRPSSRRAVAKSSPKQLQR